MFTLGTCVYDNSKNTGVMIKSFRKFYKDNKIIIIDNSNESFVCPYKKNIEVVKNNAKYLSQNIDMLIDLCRTKYLLIVSPSISFKKSIDFLLYTVSLNNAAICGVKQNRIGDNVFKDRISPHFCLVDVSSVRWNNIKYHDSLRLLNHLYDNKELKYEIGSSFTEDISNKNLFILTFSSGKEREFIKYLT